MATNYTTKTAALKATLADMSTLNTKKIKVNGKDVATSVKHPEDTREIVTENDLWATWAEITSNGEIIFHDDEIKLLTPDNYIVPWCIINSEAANVTKIENKKAYIGDNFYCNILTDKMISGGNTFALNYNIESVDSDFSSLVYGNGMFMHFGSDSKLQSFKGDLSSLIIGNDMFGGGKLSYFESNLKSLQDGNRMFNSANLTSFILPSKHNLSNLINAENMFSHCDIDNFTYDLHKLLNGSQMFYNCSNLATFDSDLSSLINGKLMFHSCSNLTTFTSDLSSLTNGYGMFQNCSNLTTFTTKLEKLKSSAQMFQGCTSLTTFVSNLSSLVNGWITFSSCSNLTTFTSDLSSLTNGYGMFRNCKLNTESLLHIAETIKNVNGLTNDKYTSDDIYTNLHLGIGNETPTEEEIELLTEIHDKGWQVFVQCNGGTEQEFNPTSLTPIDGEQTTTPKPYWAKPVETDEKGAEYVSEDGKYYIILGGQYIFVDDPETYGMFTSLENAAANMKLTKIEKTNNN